MASGARAQSLSVPGSGYGSNTPSISAMAAAWGTLAAPPALPRPPPLPILSVTISLFGPCRAACALRRFAGAVVRLRGLGRPLLPGGWSGRLRLPQRLQQQRRVCERQRARHMSMFSRWAGHDSAEGRGGKLRAAPSSFPPQDSVRLMTSHATGRRTAHSVREAAASAVLSMCV